MPNETAKAFLDGAIKDLERLSGRATMIGGDLALLAYILDMAPEIARDLGLDVDALKAAAAGEDVTKNLQEVQKLAQTLGITGTPSYVIGNELVPGAAGYDALQAKVAAMRDCGVPMC